LLGGVDVLIFTDDIGVTNWQVRDKACRGLEWGGIFLDSEANRLASKDHITLVSPQKERAKVLTVPTDEEFVIGIEGIKLMQEAGHDNL
jgi:acetate kinase